MINFADPNMRNTIAQTLMQQGARPNLSATPTPTPGGLRPQMPGPVGGIPPALGSGAAAASNLGTGGDVSGVIPPALGSDAPPPSTTLGQPSPPTMPPPPALGGTPPPPVGPSQSAGGAFGLNTPNPQSNYGGGSPTPMAPGSGNGNMAGLDPNILAQLTGVRP